MKISRQIGTTNEVLNVFINDATVSTGAGLANVVASSVSFAWFRSDQAAVSTGSCTTGTLGTFGVSSFVQALSNGALGWYQFSPPNGVFTSGKSAAIHLSGAPSMAPLPIEIELTKTDNQTYVSSQPFNVGSILQSPPVTSAAGVLSVNELTILGSTPVTNAAGVYSVDLKTIYGSAPVTTAAGVLAVAWDLGRTANLTSTIALTATTISTNQLVNANQILGSTPVTTAAGVLAVAWDLGRTANLTSTVALPAFSVAYATTVGSVAGAVGSVAGLNAALLDVSVSSRLAAAGYTVPPTVAQISSAVLTTAMGESYRASGAAGTLAQVAYELLAHHTEASISGTTKTLNKIDHLTAAATYTLDSSTAPAAITRAT